MDKQRKNGFHEEERYFIGTMFLYDDIMTKKIFSMYMIQIQEERQKNIL
jgi:hypothetical protein